VFEVIARLKDLGATDVFVDTGDNESASVFYESVGFTETYHGNVWRKGP
jgi:hypothetical protein